MGANKQSEIVDAAIRLFQQKGYHATSMQDIADGVGLQKGSLYHYISSKEDLLVQIMHDAMAHFNLRLAEIMRMDLPVRRRLELAVRWHIKGIAQNLGPWTIFLREDHALNEEQKQKIDAKKLQYNQMIEELFREGIAAGEIRKIDPGLANRTILGACNWLYRWYDPDGPMSIDDLADSMVDLLLNGAAVPGMVPGRAE